MSYTLFPAANPMAIAEQEYWIWDSAIRFTKFTSCIGLIPRRSSQVGGLHLVMVSDAGTPFDQAAADRAIDLTRPYDELVVIGQTGFWEDNVGAAYQYLLGRLPNKTIISTNDGIYGGRVHAGAFQVYEDGRYRNV